MQIVLNNNKALYVENGCYNSKCYNKNHVRVTWKFLGGGGVIKVPLGTEIPKGWGDANQKPSVGGVWIFSGTTQCSVSNKCWYLELSSFNTFVSNLFQI